MTSPNVEVISMRIWVLRSIFYWTRINDVFSTCFEKHVFYT